jgi:predicted nucleotidyltransferase component of viral defense system
MLRGRDIQTIAGREKVRDTQIEKDYVLTWLLWGMAQNPPLRQALVFKGGTVLKKAYFESYRFSEDLDFTLRTAIDNEALLAHFEAVIADIAAATAMTLGLSPIEQHQSGSIAFYVHYSVPLGGKMDNKSIKIDITRGEKLLFTPVECPIFKSYADLQDQNFTLFCYPLEELWSKN